MSKLGTKMDSKSKVQQHQRNDVDINQLIRKHGILNSPVHQKEGNFVDLSNMPSFHEMQNIVAKTKQAFERLPSHIRGKFRNKPEEMAAYLNDSKNHVEAWRLGLIKDETGEIQEKWEKSQKDSSPRESKKEATPEKEESPPK